MSGLLSWWDGFELWLSGLGFVLQTLLIMPVVLLQALVGCVHFPLIIEQGMSRGRQLQAPGLASGQLELVLQQSLG